jgi:hypothetical protein
MFALEKRGLRVCSGPDRDAGDIPIGMAANDHGWQGHEVLGGGQPVLFHQISVARVYLHKRHDWPFDMKQSFYKT